MVDPIMWLRSRERPRVLIVGDLILDAYTWGDAERISPESPVIVLRAGHEEFRPGGAASVAHLCASLGAQTFLAGIVGKDKEGSELLSIVTASGVNLNVVRSMDDRPTTCKRRFMGKASGGQPQQMLRVDHEVRDSIDICSEKAMLDDIESIADDVDVVLISDYGKGVCTPVLIQRLITLAAHLRIPVVVDPARCVSWRRYKGATVLTPNRFEASEVWGESVMSVADGIRAAVELRQQAGVEGLLLKLDGDGAVFCDGTLLPLHLKTRQRAVFDTTGAGDMVLAAFGIGLACGLKSADAGNLAMAAAGLEVERLGVAPVSIKELASELNRTRANPSDKRITVEDLVTLAADYRAQGATMVFTNGCFDIFHAGHAAYLEEAAQIGDVLIVAINSDQSVNQLKGDPRPIMDQESRAAVVASMSCVTHVVIFDERTPEDLLRRIRPDVLVKGGDYPIEDVVGAEFVNERGGRVCVTKRIEGVSTTGIVERVLRKYKAEESNAVAVD